MYGLLKFEFAEFGIKEKAFYTPYYCRICYCLRNLIGSIGGIFVDYDLVFYSILLQLELGETAPDSYDCHYFRGKERLHFLSDELGIKLAVFTMAVFKRKFTDDIADENSFKAKVLLSCLKNKLKKIQKNYSAIFNKVYSILDSTSNYESSDFSFEEVIENYGNSVVEMFSVICENISDNYRKVIKTVAKWEYFMDMLLDYKDDYKKDSFNPLIERRYKTLQDFIADSSNYLKINYYYNNLSTEMLASVEAIKCDRIEWQIVEKLITKATSKTFYKILKGEFRTNSYLSDKIYKKLHGKSRA